jgi:diguanylate cyclase (GGDEF)-like protein
LNERDKKLSQLANHDPLTGLINRHRFSEVLDQERAQVAQRGKPSALMFIDLDQFKYVNDMYGHAAGDDLLKCIAERLKAGLGERGVVCRFGGDEFIVLVSNVVKDELTRTCEVLIRMGEHPIPGSEDTFSARCSIGVTIFEDDTVTSAELLARADIACHHAKALGRNQFQFYTASSKEMNEMTADAGWSRQIQRALKEDAFALHYQPIIDINTGAPAYHEVLLRMALEPRKPVPPSAFLPAANRFGFMTEIDQWVIRNALRKLAQYREKDGDIRFTLNISASTFESADLFAYIEEQLTINGVPIDAIVLEITEQVAVRNLGNAAQQISDLAKRGFRFAIDDFGSGYSSYKYLKNLPVDFVKIDGSFVADLAHDFVDQKIIASICEIAHATNRKTIAEHVKDYETYSVLYDLGVDYAQGYFLGKPSAKLRSDALVANVATGKRRSGARA